MKWIRWGENSWFYIRDTKPSSLTDTDYKTAFNEDIIDCEKDMNWREIEFGILDTGTGKLRITLKPVEKVLTLRDAVEAYRQKLIETFGVDEWQGNSSFKQAIFDALDREASVPANPYSRESVDELLDAAEKVPWDYFRESAWLEDSNKRMARALTALKKQREAVNA